ncbi:MAG: hypothetical protein JRF59_03325 [Deltaproteobacteria bacterium]|nr:hypothetical protein [Deltaproteobacteria bacterium]MBW1922657.1 hypothetical protein [Deltaproteobacteria bacterium]MBW1948728.1 hypothetical protein [Deltaproteobacteria bacterium]MBW2007628.1 hypothetical protein [Deltaproteobacteria bacterium]MBW2103445.1 hypothetical protein [Deltaproteobacteria bacterium]
MLRCFSHSELTTLGEALDIAEDRTGNFYKLSQEQWKRHRYDVKTLASLGEEEISDHAFALLNRTTESADSGRVPTKRWDLYWICLQDHRILNALSRDPNLDLLPLMVYTFTHELVHIVRFGRFQQRFERKDKEEEESIVHHRTYEILKGVSLPALDYVLDRYREHRVCEVNF